MNAAPMCLAALSYELDRIVERRESGMRRVVRDAPAEIASVRADLEARLRAHAEAMGPLTRAVLIVDDDHALADLMAAAIEDALGVQVHVAHTIEAADALWRCHRHRVAVIDLNLGCELGTALAHSLDRGVRVVLTSGIAEPDALDAAADRLAATSLRKPPDRLVEIVSAALDHGPRARIA